MPLATSSRGESTNPPPATDGGAVMWPANRDTLHRRCQVSYLRSSQEDPFRRLRRDTQRPLLQVADPLRRLRELVRKRDPRYRKAAHAAVEAPRPSVLPRPSANAEHLPTEGTRGNQRQGSRPWVSRDAGCPITLP